MRPLVHRLLSCYSGPLNSFLTGKDNRLPLPSELAKPAPVQHSQSKYGVSVMRLFIYFTVFISYLALFWSSHSWSYQPAVTATQVADKPALPSARAISLRVLQEQLKACQAVRRCSQDLVHLAGITRIVGYLVDEGNNDVVLIGQINKASPPLYVEDFVVALRNIWRKYMTQIDDTVYYLAPGCSIDPNQKVLGMLQNIGDEAQSTTDDAERERAIEEWIKTCRLPQKVRVLGIPFDTRFAWVMVKADYDMKKLVDGSDPLDIVGFESLQKVSFDEAKKAALAGRISSIPLSSMQRFWFYSGESRYVESEGTILLKQVEVRLLTEEQHLNRRGSIIRRGGTDPLAEQFTENFTKHYAKVTKQRPIYQDLENLYRIIALVKIMKHRSALTQAGLDLSYLLNEFRVPEKHVDPQLAGHPNVLKFDKRVRTSRGYSDIHLKLPSCGGVGIDPKITPENFVPDETGRLAELTDTVLTARPATDSLFWNEGTDAMVNFLATPTRQSLIASSTSPIEHVLERSARVSQEPNATDLTDKPN